MSNEKRNDIWETLKSGRLEFVDRVKNKMLCIICKEVLINAHCGPCGCRYCLECITKYLNGEKKICPGNSNDCKDELLDINSNIFIDQVINRKLFQLIVKCPQKDCVFTDELKNIEDHIRICDSLSFGCPYVIIGCKESDFLHTDLKKHMLQEIISHTKLMFDFFGNLKNEIKALKDDKYEVEKHNMELNKCIQDFQIIYEKDYKEIKVKLKEMESKYNEEQNDSKLKYDSENKEIKEKLKEIEKKLTEELKICKNSKLKCESNHREFKDKLIEIENKLNQTEINDQLKTDMKTMNDKIESMSKDLFENKKICENSQIKCESNHREFKEKLIEIENKLNQTEINDQLKTDMKTMKEKIESMSKDLLENKKNYEITETNHREFKEKLIEMENKLNQTEINNQVKTDIKTMKDKIESKSRDLFETKRESETKIDGIDKTISDLQSISNVTNEMRVLQNNREQANCGGGFVWRIDQWTEKMEQARANIYRYYIDSESFYSHTNGYKMSLRVRPNGCLSGWGTHLGVDCCVMRGECDDILPWPFKHDVTFELIDRHATRIHTSSTVKYGDQYKDENGYYVIYYIRDNRKSQSINDSNLICGNYKFVSLKELSSDNDRSLIDNDQIFIRCRVNIR